MFNKYSGAIFSPNPLPFAEKDNWCAFLRMILGHIAVFHLPVVSGCRTASFSFPHLGTRVLQHLELRDTSKNTSPGRQVPCELCLQRSLLVVAVFGRTFTCPNSTWCLLCSAFALKELRPLLFYPCGLTEFCCADQTWCLLWCCAKPVFPAHVYVPLALILMSYTFIKPEIHLGWQCRALLSSLLCASESGRRLLWSFRQILAGSEAPQPWALGFLPTWCLDVCSFLRFSK